MDTSLDNYYHIFLIYMVQIVVLYNAAMLGWEINKIGEKRYLLTKDLKDLTDFEFNVFVQKITTF